MHIAHLTGALTIGMLPIQTILHGIPPLRSVFMQDYVAAYTLHQLVLCTELHTLRIRHRRLPYSKVALSPTPTVSLLPFGSFPQLKFLEVEEERQGKQTCDIACALVAPGSLARLQRIIITSHSMSAEEWSSVFRGIGSHTSVNEIRLKTVQCPSNSADAALALLEFLMALKRLKHLNIWFSDFVHIDTQDILRFMSRLPLLREFNIQSHAAQISHLTCTVPFATFIDILIMCPYLTGFSAAVDCSVMPTEDTVAAVELLSHPFEDMLTLTRTEGVDLHMLAVILRRMVPRVTEVFDPNNDLDELEGLLAM
jgi:hypothetical protein